MVRGFLCYSVIARYEVIFYMLITYFLSMIASYLAMTRYKTVVNAKA
jgi:hypothetical protein